MLTSFMSKVFLLFLAAVLFDARECASFAQYGQAAFVVVKRTTRFSSDVYMGMAQVCHNCNVVLDKRLLTILFFFSIV